MHLIKKQIDCWCLKLRDAEREKEREREKRKKERKRRRKADLLIKKIFGSKRWRNKKQNGKLVDQFLDPSMSAWTSLYDIHTHYTQIVIHHIASKNNITSTFFCKRGHQIFKENQNLCSLFVWASFWFFYTFLCVLGKIKSQRSDNFSFY